MEFNHNEILLLTNTNVASTKKLESATDMSEVICVKNAFCVWSREVSSTQLLALHVSLCPALKSGLEQSVSSSERALALNCSSRRAVAAHSSLIQQTVRSCQSACRYANAARLGLDEAPANTLSLIITRPQPRRTVTFSISLSPATH